MKVTDRIRAIRVLKGFSQEYVAQQLGISQKAYSKIENGNTKISLDRIVQLANIFSCHISEIIFDKPLNIRTEQAKPKN